MYVILYILYFLILYFLYFQENYFKWQYHFILSFNFFAISIEIQSLSWQREYFCVVVISKALQIIFILKLIYQY